MKRLREKKKTRSINDDDACGDDEAPGSSVIEAETRAVLIGQIFKLAHDGTERSSVRPGCEDGGC
jgi:hypothetical protein